MATTAKQDKKSREYYAKNKAYRKKKIEQATKQQQTNREEYNKTKREYYAKNASYRKYKIAYASRYRKENPIKSRAKKYRAKVK